jgi:hypothetical protein
VDGELGHDSRDRVLAHLATCAKCMAEADAQRRLKNVFAEAAPPPPSESLLARLQGLPGGGDPGAGVFDMSREERFAFGYVPARPHQTSASRGFPIHPVGRPEADRSSSFGMRFAFVAAGAVSLAAIALGGVTSGTPGSPTADARGSAGTGSATPARPAGNGGATAPESQRRRSAAQPFAQGAAPGQSTAVPALDSAPLLPGVLGVVPAGQDTVQALNTPLMAGAAVISPLIRPLGTPPPVALMSWSMASEAAVHGLLAAPGSATAAPSSSPSSPSSALPSASSRPAP